MAKAFFGIGKADATSSEGGRLPFFEAKSENEAGRFLVEIVACKLATRTAPFFIVECVAVESNVENCPAGEQFAWVQGLTQDLGPLSVKRFLAAAMGMDPKSDEANEEITDEVAEASVGDANPLAGTRLRLRTRHHITQKKTVFTIHDWMPLEAVEEADGDDPKDNE